MRLLVVDDEREMAEALRRGLSNVGYVVDVVHDGADAIAFLHTTTFDGVVLDVMLPSVDGFKVVSTIRREHNRTPILLLTARSEVDSRVRGLDLGADDYLVKPFDFEELLARVRALLRRGPADLSTPLAADDLTLDPASHVVRRAGTELTLTAREFQLLELLLRNKNRVMSRHTIFERVWAHNAAVTDKVVDVYISYLRAKVDRGFDRPLVHTVRGGGYVLREPPDDA